MIVTITTVGYGEVRVFGFAFIIALIKLSVDHPAKLPRSFDYAPLTGLRIATHCSTELRSGTRVQSRMERDDEGLRSGRLCLTLTVLCWAYSIQFNGTPDARSPRLVPETPPAPFRRSESVGPRSSSPARGRYGDRLTPRDLSNRKLAQNQTELFQQIADLRSVIEQQGELLRLLVEREKNGRQT